jgi:hypothetical protein
MGHSSVVTRFMYSGSTCMRAMNEPVEKSFLVIDKGAVTRVPLKTRPFFSYVVLDEKVVGKCLEEAAKAPPDSLVRVKHDPRIVKIEERFRTANGTVHFVFRPIPVTIAGDKTFDPNSIKDASLESCLGVAVDRKQDEEFFSFMLSTLTSKKPKDTIQEFRKKIVGE